MELQLDASRCRRYHPPMTKRNLEDLIRLVHFLRAENGCPWDRERNTKDMSGALIEEAYELQWACQKDSVEETKDELADVFYLCCYITALLQEDEPGLSIDDLADHVYEKIERRHPHVFGDKKAKDIGESIDRWNDVKRSEKERSLETGVLEDLQGNLPPLRLAEEMQRRAAEVGFDWPDVQGIMEKLREEVEEVSRCTADGTRAEIIDEIGDLLFTVVNLARFLDVDSEQALSGTNAKFLRRFRKMEMLVARDGKKISSLNIDELDAYWNLVKAED